MSLHDAAHWIRKARTALVRALRKQFGPIEYYETIETHKSGWPHLHLLLRAPYIPQRIYSALWLGLTGSFKAHIQGVQNTGTAVHECIKYYLKSARTLHQLAPNVRVYAYSRNWLPDGYHEHPDRDPDIVSLGFNKLPPATLDDIAELLGFDVTPDPLSPHRATYHLRAPPHPRLLQELRQSGSFSLGRLGIILTWWIHSQTHNLEDLHNQFDLAHLWDPRKGSYLGD